MPGLWAVCSAKEHGADAEAEDEDERFASEDWEQDAGAELEVIRQGENDCGEGPHEQDEAHGVNATRGGAFDQVPDGAEGAACDRAGDDHHGEMRIDAAWAAEDEVGPGEVLPAPCRRDAIDRTDGCAGEWAEQVIFQLRGRGARFPRRLVAELRDGFMGWAGFHCGRVYQRGIFPIGNPGAGNGGVFYRKGRMTE